MVLFPAVLALLTERGCPVREGTVPDSVEGDDSEDDDGFSDTGILGTNDPACDGGSRDGGCVCSCKAELGHLNVRVRKLENMVCLLVTNAGLAEWEETWRVENLRRRMELERGVAERDHGKKVVAERAAGEEKKRIARRDEQARKADEVRKSQKEAARLRNEQVAATMAALDVSVGECIQATTPKKLVPRAAKVAEAAEGVKRAEAIPSPACEDVDVGGGWRGVGGSVVRKVEVVSRLVNPVGRVRTMGLPGGCGEGSGPHQG